MELTTFLIIIITAFLLIFLGRILDSGLKWVFYLLLILLAAVLVFGISLGEMAVFLKKLIFMSF